jgi:RNA polymerase sigma factor (sigma-70 family)
MHDAFVRVLGRFRDLRDPAAFRSYFRVTVVNLARSHFRRARVERAFLDRSRLEPPSFQPGSDPHQELLAALGRLSPRQRAAVVLRYYEDLTEAQTADILRCPVGTVKSMVSRALGRLRKEMEQSE